MRMRYNGHRFVGARWLSTKGTHVAVPREASDHANPTPRMRGRFGPQPPDEGQDGKRPRKLNYYKVDAETRKGAVSE